MLVASISIRQCIGTVLAIKKYYLATDIPPYTTSMLLGHTPRPPILYTLGFQSHLLRAPRSTLVLYIPHPIYSHIPIYTHIPKFPIINHCRKPCASTILHSGISLNLKLYAPGPSPVPTCLSPAPDHVNRHPLPVSPSLLLSTPSPSTALVSGTNSLYFSLTCGCTYPRLLPRYNTATSECSVHLQDLA